MVVGITIFIMAVLIIAIYILIEVKRLRHKLFAIFLIGLILFTYISFAVVLRGQDIDFKTITGLAEGSKLYFSWLVYVFVNLKTITIQAIQMDWGSNETNR